MDEASITSRWSHSSKVKPLFDSDMLSIVSKWSEAGTVDALFDVVENGGSKDDPWKAAKRGDLKALKKFHKKKKFDWSYFRWRRFLKKWQQEIHLETKSETDFPLMAKWTRSRAQISSVSIC